MEQVGTLFGGQAMTLLIGLTGGIASGKTTATDAFRALGVTVIDADEISRELTGPGGKALPDIALAFGPDTIGVRGMKVFGDDEVVSMEIAEEGKDILFVSEKGMGKRTPFSEFNAQGRGGKGSRGYKVTEKTGVLVGTESVSADQEIMIITTEGIIIRTPVNTISQLGKTASGVKLINIDKESEARVASFTVIREDDSEEEGEGEETDTAEVPDQPEDASETPDSTDEN
jgi:hypothetical protein